MSEFRLATVEEFEAATARLLETAAKVGADTWQARVEKIRHHIVNSEKKESVAVFVLWDLVAVEEELQEECADVMFMVSLVVTT